MKTYGINNPFRLSKYTSVVVYLVRVLAEAVALTSIMKHVSVFYQTSLSVRFLYVSLFVISIFMMSLWFSYKLSHEIENEAVRLMMCFVSILSVGTVLFETLTMTWAAGSTNICFWVGLCCIIIGISGLLSMFGMILQQAVGSGVKFYGLVMSSSILTFALLLRCYDMLDSYTVISGIVLLTLAVCLFPYIDTIITGKNEGTFGKHMVICFGLDGLLLFLSMAAMVIPF